MVKWIDKDLINKRGAKTTIEAATFQDAYNIIREQAKAREVIPYSKLEDKLKTNGHRKIHRGTIGGIVGEVSDQISLVTSPSVYPSSIVVHKGTKDTGDGFWTLENGTLPPSTIPVDLRKKQLDEYQKNVFDKVGR